MPALTSSAATIVERRRRARPRPSTSSISPREAPETDGTLGHEAEPPGRGKFLVKVGGRPGIPVNVQLTQVELSLHDTNRLWNSQSRVGSTLQESS